MTSPDFLFELGTEELPAKLLPSLIADLQRAVQLALVKAQLPSLTIDTFATPRRLAILIRQLPARLPDSVTERRGPALNAAFDAQGKPTPALLGFARSCGVDYTALATQETPQGSWLVHRQEMPGAASIEMMPALLAQAVAAIKISKPMRWGNAEFEFIRPVQWLVLLYGSAVVPGTILGAVASNVSYGHRFHHPAALPIKVASEYAATLEHPGHVMADFNRRRAFITQQVEHLAQQVNGTPLSPEHLLIEVTGLVEWPVGLLVPFDEHFLAVPRAALIAAIQGHQKSFPLIDAAGNLLPYFITISNLDSTDQIEVVRGNQRVMQARLADAKFFYEADLKVPLEAYLPRLQTVAFVRGLGSLHDKALRVSELSGYVASQINADAAAARRAGLLAKADLVSTLVNEFPELQGTMGGHYARAAGETVAVAQAIAEHYAPRVAGDDHGVPASLLSCAVALADRLDTLVGIFGMNSAPTGDKDPFALRRAAIGVLRILIEQKLPLNLLAALEQAQHGYAVKLPNAAAAMQAFDFIYERLRAWYQEQGINTDVFAAVYAVRPAAPADFALRIHAITEFCRLPQAAALIAANKRVSNLLRKEQQAELNGAVATELLGTAAEQNLASALAQQQVAVRSLSDKTDYTTALIGLAQLQPLIDAFFATVLVMVEDPMLQHNRLLLLSQLRALFLTIADISLLQDTV